MTIESSTSQVGWIVRLDTILTYTTLMDQNLCHYQILKYLEITFFTHSDLIQSDMDGIKFHHSKYPEI